MSTAISQQVYAILSDVAYNANRGNLNQITNLAATGFIQVNTLPNTSSNPLSSGFSATAFVDQSGDNVVIAFEGTDLLLGANANVGQSLADFSADIGLGLGFSSSQLLQAAEFYEQCKEQYPNATISFTGHSLGGGLASIMAVLFSKSAIVFDEAPFNLTMLSLATAANVYSGLLNIATNLNASLQQYAPDTNLENFISNSNNSTSSWLTSNISNYYVPGEFLSLFIGNFAFLGGLYPVPVGGNGVRNFMLGDCSCRTIR